MKPEFAQKILEQTAQNYNIIACNYARTRAFVPQDLRDIVLKYLKPGRILDSGCANGRLWELLSPRVAEYVGIDQSEALLNIARLNYPRGKFIQADALKLPFPNGCFDEIFSISVLHHFPGKALQEKYLQESARVLQSGGLLVLRVWDLRQQKRVRQLIFKNALLKLIGFNKMDFGDIIYPWKDGRGCSMASRYFHCFTQEELSKMAQRCGFRVKEIFVEGKSEITKNIYLIAEKI